VVCLAQRAPGDSVRPRRLCGAGARPLNFVRRRIMEALRYSLMAAFALSGVFSVLGNALVCVLLRSQGVPVRFMRAGQPFYLYGLCNRAEPPVAPYLRRLALASNIAWIVAFLLAVPLFMFQNDDSPTSNNPWRGP
jgi:hypothetical protein